MNETTRILCISDTENNYDQIQEFSIPLLQFINKADIVIHLGDGIKDFAKIFSKITQKEIVYIKGNHDINSEFGLISFDTEFNGVKIFFYHGLSFNRRLEKADMFINQVRKKLGLKINLGWYFRNQQKNLDGKYDLVVHGHIHTPRIHKSGKTIYYCPGAITPKTIKLHQPMSFGLIEISENQSKKIRINTYKIDSRNKNVEIIKLPNLFYEF